MTFLIALYQFVGKEQRTIQFYSRKLSDTESKYSTFDRELLAAHDAVRYFLPYIDGQDVSLLTDHKPLVSAFVKKSESKSDRQARHLNFLSEHLHSNEFVKGEENIISDFLSRLSDGTTVKVNSIHIEQFDLDMLANEQSADLELQSFIAGKPNFTEVTRNSAKLICETSTGRYRPFVPASK